MAKEIKDDNKKCDCGEYYSLDIFENRCSLCFHKNNPSKYLEIMKRKPKKFHTNTFLQNYTHKYSIKDVSNIYESLELIISTELNFKIEDLLILISYIKIKTNFKGISCNQAVNLYNKYHNYHTNRVKLQHVLAGMVIDWWNLNKYINTLGPIICYYDNNTNDGKEIELLRYGKKIVPCPAFSDDSQMFWIKSIIGK